MPIPDPAALFTELPLEAVITYRGVRAMYLPPGTFQAVAKVYARDGLKFAYLEVQDDGSTEPAKTHLLRLQPVPAGDGGAIQRFLVRAGYRVRDGSVLVVATGQLSNDVELLT